MFLVDKSRRVRWSNRQEEKKKPTSEIGGVYEVNGKGRTGRKRTREKKLKRAKHNNPISIARPRRHLLHVLDFLVPEDAEYWSILA